MSLRCLIVDDNTDYLVAARSALESQGIEVVGIAATSAEALRRAEALRPDVALVDIGLGDESGFELALRLVDGAAQPITRVVLISTRAEDDYADMIATSPAVGFLSKSDVSAHALQGLLDGGV
ncbi:MAG: two-component system, NarL family, invasion response regulator UvrY [Gaiellales bacterium]|jgi:DNA-binding NarL/FixJ family response regulator|nr:two-component system, NarL family, invasion response regulator UvrY [Gaiellales bacterium]